MPFKDVERQRMFSRLRWVRLTALQQCVCGESVAPGHTYCAECLRVKRIKRQHQHQPRAVKV